jgi:transposase
MDLTDEQWGVLKPIIPAPPRRPDRRGRPWRDPRAVLHSIRWIWRTGAQWKDLPERYPPSQTGHRRFQAWVRSGVLEQSLQAVAADLRERGELELSECFIDGTFDSDPREESLAAQGIEMLAPHRAQRKTPNTQDGRPLRR